MHKIYTCKCKLFGRVILTWQILSKTSVNKFIFWITCFQNIEKLHTIHQKNCNNYKRVTIYINGKLIKHQILTTSINFYASLFSYNNRLHLHCIERLYHHPLKLKLIDRIPCWSMWWIMQIEMLLNLLIEWNLKL